jgi:(p)ppGpp synthase/HD superfamily hydrolase
MQWPTTELLDIGCIKPTAIFDSGQQRARQWAKDLLELQQRAGDPLEFIESLKIDLFPDEVYVFTPRGQIRELPTGASAVDFAYGVHTDIGNSCVACRIDGKLAPLSQQLDSGQRVEIITAKESRPNPDWLTFVGYLSGAVSNSPRAETPETRRVYPSWSQTTESCTG